MVPALLACAMVLVAACSPPPPPPLAWSRFENITQGIVVRSATDPTLYCAAELDWQLAIRGTEYIDITTTVGRVYGSLPLCVYQAWSGLNAWANCGLGHPDPTAPPAFWCGSAAVGTQYLEQRTVTLLTTKSMRNAALALHFEGTFAGVKTTRDGWSSFIDCEPAQCYFVPPNPN